MSAGIADTGHRDIVLEAGAMTALSLGHRFAQLPHGLGLRDRAGQHRVLDGAALSRLPERRGQMRDQVLPWIRRGEFDQQVPGRILTQGDRPRPARVSR